MFNTTMIAKSNSLHEIKHQLRDIIHYYHATHSHEGKFGPGLVKAASHYRKANVTSYSTDVTFRPIPDDRSLRIHILLSKGVKDITLVVEADDQTTATEWVDRLSAIEAQPYPKRRR